MGPPRRHEIRQFGDPTAEAYIEECLRKRLDKIGNAYFVKVLPFDRFRIADGRLRWDDLARDSDLGGIGDVRVQWRRVENVSGAKSAIAGADSAKVPEGAKYLVAELSSPARPKQMVTVYLRGAEIVGVDRAW